MSSNPEIVTANAEFPFEFEKSWAYVNLTSTAEVGDADITVSVETEDGKIHIQKYYLNVCKSTVGIDDTSDENGRTTVYSINGVKVANSLDNPSPGIYIVNKNGGSQKIVVR